ncbi:MAG TPA: hypothetical protein PLU43_10910, partial [Lachnospiraceae bacterium]|nr:hypothetical protein [Lachnospiraceae bacterium]
ETAQTANELLKKNLSVISVARNDKKILPEKDHASDRAGDREGIGYTVPVTYDFKKEQSVFKEAERKPQTEEPEQSRIQPLFSRIKEEAADDAALTLTSEADIMKPIPKKQEQLMDSTAMSSALQQKKQPVKGSTRMGENNNQRILELYGQKKSYVEIARELNLGVGEVKLVIDLFKG